MGRKMPEKSAVDLYRKTIGKQDYKKSKPELKEAKNRSLAKKTAAYVYQDIGIMVAAILVLVFAVYTILYVLISNDK